MRSALVWLALISVVSAGCHSSTSPSTTTTTTTTTTAASPTATESFSGRLDVGATLTFPFAVGVYGTVNATLLDISGAKVPSTVQVRLGIGTPDDSGGCTATTFSLVRAGSTAQVTATEEAGSYCVSVADVGNLVAPATFDVTVAHP